MRQDLTVSIKLIFSSVIETYHGESITLVSVGTQKKAFCFSLCVFMVPNINDFIAIITSVSKIEDFKFVYCCFMKISN